MQNKGSNNKTNIRHWERCCRIYDSLCLAILVSIIVSCASVPKKRDYGTGYRESITASWYGEDFHGRMTANGEKYDMHALTAAHKTIPFNTYLLVTSRENGRSVKVKVNDRGPFVRGRSLDLSYGAAKRLDMIGTGTARVDIEIISLDERQKGDAHFAIQVGAFTIEENAARLRKRLEDYYGYRDIRIIPYETNSKRYLRVRVGSFSSEQEALEISRRLKSKEDLDSFVLRDD